MTIGKLVQISIVEHWNQSCIKFFIDGSVSDREESSSSIFKIFTNVYL